MPHATEDGDTMADIDEEREASRYLGTYGQGGVAEDFMTKEIDQRDKADDAVDYEDISDLDDLPDEEDAPRTSLEDDHDDLPTQTAMNGFHDMSDPNADLFGDPDDVNDLFGDRNLSPESERQSYHQTQPQRPMGLALPTKSSLALPTMSSASRQVTQHNAQRLDSSSPQSYHDRETSFTPADSMTSEDEDGLDDDEALQSRLFRNARRRAAGEDVMPESIEEDPDLFYTLFPGFEEYQAPKFLELFPPKNGLYKGKTHIKPPKPVDPAKLSLDLLQDQERSFKASSGQNNQRVGLDSTYNSSFVALQQQAASDDSSDDDIAGHFIDKDERVGNVTYKDLVMICEDWDITSQVSEPAGSNSLPGSPMEIDSEGEERPIKKRKISFLGSGVPSHRDDMEIAFEEPERAVAKLSKSFAVDLNDPYLLIDENSQGIKRKIRRTPGDIKRDTALSRDLTQRYNISNDKAYDLLKENHQNKVRSTIGSLAVEHSFPAVKLQYPFYKVRLDSNSKRSFHRPHLDLRSTIGREVRVQKPRHLKRKHMRTKEAKEVYAKAEDLSFGDNASSILLEYSEEAPMMMSNFGMGNRLINYYRKKDSNDNERPKRDIGETQVLLTQDKSPFANFGHVDGGEVVPTIQNELYRAPVFEHQAKPTDFLLNFSSTYEHGDRLYMRNIENLHTVGQQFPSAEVPGQHARKVTDASKKRLKAISYRLYNKSIAGRKDKVLDNNSLVKHLLGHDLPQTRSKMREFFTYQKGPGSGTTGRYVPKGNEAVPDDEGIRSWIRPEDICLLDTMQAGVQHLSDLGITETRHVDNDKEDYEDGPGVTLEQELAPWRVSKNFLQATQGKSMVALWGEGDPTGCDQGFSFVKTSMKGGFVPQGESAADKIDTRRRKETGGHLYNVAKQQTDYDEAIRGIWERQKQGLSTTVEISDDEADDDAESSYLANGALGRAQTPRSSIAGTPAPRHDDDYTSQFSRHSATRGGDQVLVIRRAGARNDYGEEEEPTTEVVTNPRVIALYRKRAIETTTADQSIEDIARTGNRELDRQNEATLKAELARIQRNMERRQAREKLKANKASGNSAVAGSPGPSEADGASTADGTPQKGKGRNKDGTQRKCANCGQVGHIKTNRKLCPMLNGTLKTEDAGVNGDSSFGAVPAQLTL